MNKLLCAIFGHRPAYHLGTIWSGALERDHGVCTRCGKTTRFERPDPARLLELEALNDTRDCTNAGCIPL